jgi:cell division protein FtsB
MISRAHIKDYLDWVITNPVEIYFLEHFNSLDKQQQDEVLLKFRELYFDAPDLEGQLCQAEQEIEELKQEVTTAEDELEELKKELLDKTNSDII